MEIHVDLRGPDLTKWIHGVARDQIPFALSMTLNNIARRLGVDFVDLSQQRFNVRSAWSRTARRGSISKGNTFVTDASAYFTTQISKKVPLAKMSVRVGTASWQIKQQTDPSGSARTPQYVTTESRRGKKISFIAVPITPNVQYVSSAARLKPNAQHLLDNPIATRSFVLDAKGGSKILCQRHGSGPNDYKALYVLVNSVNITPKFNFEQVVEKTVNKMFAAEFDKQMAAAIKTART